MFTVKHTFLANRLSTSFSGGGGTVCEGGRAWTGMVQKEQPSAPNPCLSRRKRRPLSLVTRDCLGVAGGPDSQREAGGGEARFAG